MIAGLVIGGIGFLAFIYSGIYSVAATHPHTELFRWAVSTFQSHSISRQSRDIIAPPLADARLIARGFEFYQDECVICHGAPGVAAAQTGWGINPNPPPLTVVAGEWTDAELFWIVNHGIKLAGMPAYQAGNSDAELWAATAFVRRLEQLSVAEYAAMIAAAAGTLEPADVAWLEREDPGWQRLAKGGDPRRGEALLAEFGCGSCHVIPGVSWARGKAGPPLTRWAERHYVAGKLINNPSNLVRWIVDPQAIEPGTAMPDLGVSTSQALDIAAYLFTLGHPRDELRR